MEAIHFRLSQLMQMVSLRDNRTPQVSGSTGVPSSAFHCSPHESASSPNPLPKYTGKPGHFATPADMTVPFGGSAMTRNLKEVGLLPSTGTSAAGNAETKGGLLTIVASSSNCSRWYEI